MGAYSYFAAGSTLSHVADLALPEFPPDPAPESPGLDLEACDESQLAQIGASLGLDNLEHSLSSFMDVERAPGFHGSSAADEEALGPQGPISEGSMMPTLERDAASALQGALPTIDRELDAGRAQSTMDTLLQPLQPKQPPSVSARLAPHAPSSPFPPSSLATPSPSAMPTTPSAVAAPGADRLPVGADR